MSLMDTLKSLVGKGREAAAENAEKVHEAVDKAGGFVDERTGGKYSDQIGKGVDALKNAIPERDQPEPPPPHAPESPAEPEG
jgi:hypothetical protein